MSFLSKISSLRKSIPTAAPLRGQEKDKKVQNEEHSLLPKNYVREEDPAVRRLKELRRQELLKNGELSKRARSQAKSTAPRKKRDPDEGYPTDTRFKKKVGTSAHPSRPMSTPRKTEPIKKLSFEELMKQAENNAHEKGSNKSTSPSRTIARPGVQRQSPPQSHSKKIGFKSKMDKSHRKPTSPAPSRPKTGSHGAKSEPVKIRTLNTGFAQPNEKIRRQLEQRKRHSRPQAREDEFESDMDDFIEDDTEDMNGRHASRPDTGYNRDEIWAMFNRGKRRSEMAFDDYEDDDMEANEMEILEEEEKASRMARLEDKREEEWLKKHEQEKKRRKRMKG